MSFPLWAYYYIPLVDILSAGGVNSSPWKHYMGWLFTSVSSTPSSTSPSPSICISQLPLNMMLWACESVIYLFCSANHNTNVCSHLGWAGDRACRGHCSLSGWSRAGWPWCEAERYGGGWDSVVYSPRRTYCSLLSATLCVKWPLVTLGFHCVCNHTMCSLVCAECGLVFHSCVLSVVRLSVSALTSSCQVLWYGGALFYFCEFQIRP